MPRKELKSKNLFSCPDLSTVSRTRGPVLPPLEGRGGYKKGACPRRRRGFESRFPLQFKPRFGGFFSYVSEGYVALARLYGCSGRVCDFSESGWILGKKRVI